MCQLTATLPYIHPNYLKHSVMSLKRGLHNLCVVPQGKTLQEI
jgi:hypothetical protein